MIPLGNQFTDDSHEYNFRYLYDHAVPAHILHAAEPEAIAQFYDTLRARIIKPGRSNACGWPTGPVAYTGAATPPAGTPSC